MMVHQHLSRSNIKSNSYSGDGDNDYDDEKDVPKAEFTIVFLNKSLLKMLI